MIKYLMKKWRIKEEENIADVALEIYGADEVSLFENIVEVFASIITDHRALKAVKKKTVEIEEADFSNLIAKFINRLIYLKDVEFLLFKKGKFTIKKNKRYKLKADLFGQKADENLAVKIDIKALTQHKFKVTKDKNYKVTLVFDV